MTHTQTAERKTCFLKVVLVAAGDDDLVDLVGVRKRGLIKFYIYVCVKGLEGGRHDEP